MPDGYDPCRPVTPETAAMHGLGQRGHSLDGERRNPQGARAGGGRAPRHGGSRRLLFRADQRHAYRLHKDPNPAPEATLREALQKIAAMPRRPAFLLHTGDVSHLSKPSEFEAASGIVQTAGLETFYVPGEHDTINDDGKEFFSRFSPKGAQPGGWYSFDRNGIHFIGLVNVVNLKAGGLGNLDAEQLRWLEADTRGLSASTPIVVFAHMPLWSLYPDWGWGTDGSAQALATLKRFGSVTVLNGHIHQVQQKIEGNVTFQTARSTAFPQPAPGQGAGPVPMQVPAAKLRSVLGIREIEFVGLKPALADTALAS